MERRRVAVTGLGTVNPTGLSVEESWQNIRQGKVAIAPIERFDTTDFRVKLAGEIRHFDPTRWMDRKEARRLALFSQYAMAAAVEAIKQAGISCDPENPDPKTGVLISSGIGGLSVIEEEHDRGKEKGFERVSPLFIPLTISNMAAGNIAIRFGFQGMCSCTVTACAGGSNAIGDAFHRIRDGYEDVMVCGGTEAAITPLSIGGFAAMRALSTATDPLRASIPFDADRGGFVMGEGAGVLVLEEWEHAKKRGARILAELVGYGANCDAYHITAPSPNGRGAAACMELALEDAGISAKEISYINAHGTSTKLNDAGETAAIHQVFGDHARDIPVSSTKSMTGHLLGAAGGVEAVFCVMSLVDQFVPMTAGYRTPDPACDLDYVTEGGRSMPLSFVLSDNLGFGGHNAVLIFKKAEA
ncbi:MAG TPA: beta-ketoacyl-[acyl-carrier-protein] synthase II [Lachnospiraceae bacterium]|jgi:3-oxoacyl-[acyl-carrier-protein] synthase II|nr:beta-ketoacyl-[acyl-carrier-protein] synthase II [Lachnospiraceae bacterium]